MSRLWSCGFELQSASSLVEWDTTTGSPTISTSTKRSGAAALRCNTSSAAAYLSHQIYASAATTAHVYMRAYVYIASLPSAKTMLMMWADDTNFGYGVRLHTDGTLRIEASNDFQFSSFSAGALSTGQWYRLEIDYSDSTDVCTAYVDGSQVATLSSADTFGGDRFLIGSFDAVTADLYFDDVAINDAGGSAQNGLPGAGSIVHMQPDADGDSKQWQSSASTTTGTATVSAINEVTPDDVTTYNRRTTTTTKIDDWNMESSSAAGIGASDTVTLVEHGGRYGSTSATATARTVVKRIKGQASGTTSTSASTAINANGWMTHQAAVPRLSNLVAYVNPQTSTAWTPSTLDTMQIGVQANTSSTNEIRYSALWALVEYVPVESHTTSGTGSATASATATDTTVRTTARTAGAMASTSATDTTVRTSASTLSATVSATATDTTIRTTARTAAATASATATDTTVRTTARTAAATASATATDTTVRTSARTAAAVASASATDTTVRTTSATARATATATYTSPEVAVTAGTGYAVATATATDTTVRTTARTAAAMAGASATDTTVRTTSATLSATASATAADTTVRTTTATARALASASGESSAIIFPVKVREAGEWVSATVKVRESGAWVVAEPRNRQSGEWS